MAARGRGGAFRGSSVYSPFSGYGGAGAAAAAGAGFDYNSYYGYANPGGFGMGGMPGAVPQAAAMGAAGAAGMVKPKTHTSSSDPKAVKSRVFVGNLNTTIATREQLEMLYCRFGTVVGLSMHKGFAFVQYSSEDQARNAVSFTDGMTVAGQVLDVNIADEPKTKKGEKGPNAGLPAFGNHPQLTKRSRFDAGLDAEAEIIEYAGHEDYLKCGHCQSNFRSWQKFKDHRSKPCMKKEGEMDTDMENGKADGEPAVISCFICKSEYTASWGLIQHLADKHNMTVYTT